MTTYRRQTYLRMSPLFHSTYSQQSNFHGGEKVYMLCGMSSSRRRPTANTPLTTDDRGVDDTDRCSLLRRTPTDAVATGSVLSVN